MKVSTGLWAMFALFSAVPAGAVTFSVGAIDSGPIDDTGSYRPGYTLYDFNSGFSPFTGGAVRSGTVAADHVAPAGDTTPYFAVGPSTSSPATLALTGIERLSFYWGSIDLYNVVTFDGLGQSFAGGLFGATDSPVYRPSRLVTFRFTPAESAALRGITLSSGSHAFELDNLIFGSSVPEPGTWGMAILGVGMVGGALRRRRTTAVQGCRAV